MHTTVTATNIPDWQDTLARVASRNAEDKFFDAIGDAVMQYAKDKSAEAAQWENAYRSEKAKNDYLVALLKQNGIPVPDFSTGVQLLADSPKNEGGKNVKTFRQLVQTDDVDDTLARLHAKIDGKGGKDVAMVLHKALDDKLISRFPTEKEFRTEFTDIIGKWRSIRYYLQTSHPVDYSSVTI